MSKSALHATVAIPEFYAGKSILITGWTGFVGKVLVEKMLRSCPDTKEIYLLTRPKKGHNIEDRLRQIISLPLFDRVRKERPNCFSKLIPVSGDVAEEGLGLATVERRLLIDRVSVIFHVAANVRFDDDLKDAVFVNTRSTRDVCILAGNMKNLVALVHVSSTYTQVDKPVVEEKMYPFDVSWKKTIKVAEAVDEHMLRTMTAKYLGTIPNTYTFTKRLAEQIINDYSSVLPCVLLRPSIVVSSVNEPVVGWLDNFNGPVGLMVGGGKGVLRVVHMNPDAAQDFIPVDVCVKTMLIAAWKRGLVTITQDPTPHVYNCASGDVKQISMKQVIEVALRTTEEFPLDGVLWVPGVKITSNKMLFYTMTLLLHFVPAIIVDSFLKLTGGRPMLLRLQRKVYISNSSLSYYVLNEWKFINNKLLKLMTDLLAVDQTDFGFAYYDFDVFAYFKNCLIGSKRYLLKEDVESWDKPRQHYNRMWWIDRLLKVWLGILVFTMFYRNDVFAYLFTMLQTMVDGSIFA